MNPEIQASPAKPAGLPDRFNIADHFILPNLAPERAGRVYLRLAEPAGTGGEDAPQFDPQLFDPRTCQTLTFGGLHRRANRFANALVRLGLRPGERLALLMRESLDFPVCFWGAVRAGVIPVPLNTALPAADYRHFLEDSQAAALVVDSGLWPSVKKIVEEAVSHLPHPRRIIAGDRPRDGETPDGPLLAELMKDQAEDFETVLSDPGAPAFWLYTSGSTGQPKAAVHRHGDMALVARHYLEGVLRLEPDDLAFSAPKMFFAYGLGNSLYFPLASGSAAVIQAGPATAESCFSVLVRHRPTVFYAVPSLFSAMLDRYEAWLDGEAEPPHPLPPAGPLGAERLELENLRLTLSGGEVLPAGLYHRWRRHFGRPILDGLGSTEALHFYLSNTPEANRPGSAGRIVPGYQAKLVDEMGGEPPPGEAGELWLRGGSLASAGRDGNAGPGGGPAAERWLATGDRLRRDAEGFFYYEGRTDDMIKVAGAWVSPAEVEAVLAGHPAVAECAVTGISGPDGLTRIVAHVVLKPVVLKPVVPNPVVPKPAVPTPEVLHPEVPRPVPLRPGHDPHPDTEAMLLAHAAGRLPPFKIPAEIRFSSSLPKTASGKTRRFLLRPQKTGAPPPDDGKSAGTGSSA